MTSNASSPDPEKLIQRYCRAKERRSPWEGHWQECYAHALPHREAAITATAPGSKKGTRLYDGTATDAVDQLAASLLSELTPPWDQWFDFKPGKEAPDEAHQKMSEILGHAASVLQGHFDRSNFAVEMREWQPGGRGSDDGLDAVAGCLLSEPVRLAEPGRVRDPRARGMTAWRGSASPVRIDADFDV